MLKDLKVSRDTMLAELIGNGCTVGDLVDILNNEMTDVFTPKVPVADGEDKKESLRNRVTAIWRKAGIPAHLKGYRYAIEAVIDVYERPNMIDAITKELYPAVAEVYDTTPFRVERAIRHAIEVAWNRGSVEFLDGIFGYTIHYEKSKPTNSEFIAGIVEYLREQD